MKTDIETKSCEKCIHKLDVERLQIKMRYIKILVNLEMDIKNNISEMLDDIYKIHKNFIKDYIEDLKDNGRLLINNETIKSDFADEFDVVFDNIFKEFQRKMIILNLKSMKNYER